MRRIEAQLDSAHLVDGTEDYALKTPDRFKEKVAREKERNPDKPTEEVISEIHDAVRYTFILDIDEYHKTYWEAEGKLESQGYELEVRRNMWASLEYKGINSRWRDPGSSLPFEIQFHTENSWSQSNRRMQLTKRSRTSGPLLLSVNSSGAPKEISSKIQEPPRVMEIPDYREKGRMTVAKDTKYYAVMDSGRTTQDPSGLVRRRTSTEGRIDEALQRDLEWIPSSAIVEWELWRCGRRTGGDQRNRGPGAD
jgi:hypothetical protein